MFRRLKELKTLAVYLNSSIQSLRISLLLELEAGVKAAAVVGEFCVHCLLEDHLQLSILDDELYRTEEEPLEVSSCVYLFDK